MAVLMADLRLGVRERQQVDDTDGYEFPAGTERTRGPWPGRARRRSDGTWALALDPRAWPLTEDDVVVEVRADGAAARTWVVGSAEQRTNTAAPDVDHVYAEARLRAEVDDADSTP